MKRLRDEDEMFAEITKAGKIYVEKHYVGELQGFKFTPDNRSDGIRGKAARNAAAKVLAKELAIAAEEKDTASDEKARVVEALHTLSEEMRSVVVLNVYQWFRYQEIAGILEIPLGTVKTRMFHALRKLRKVMGYEP